MSGQLDIFVIAWVFAILIGGCVLINILIDLGAPPLLKWAKHFWRAHHHPALNGPTEKQVD
jgi:hypothetical protein